MPSISDMFSGTQSKDLMFSMISQQMSKVPSDVREALSRVDVIVEKDGRGFSIRIGKSDDPRIEDMIHNSVENWCDLLARGFNAMGYKVKLYE